MASAVARLKTGKRKTRRDPPDIAGLSLSRSSEPVPEPTTDNPGGAQAIMVQNGKPKYLHDHSHRHNQRRASKETVTAPVPPPVITTPLDPNTVLFFSLLREGNTQKVKGVMRSRNMNLNTRDLNDPEQPTALIVACENDHTDIVKIMLTMKKSKYLDVNQENRLGRRPIWIAALKGNHEIADLLLNSKGTECDVNFIDKETGTSPLYRAILSNSAKTVQLLIAAKADVNMRRMGFDSKDMKAETPLIKAIQMDNIQIVQHLVNALCKLEAKTEDGLTAIHFAVAYRRYDITEFLLQNEIRIHAKSNHGITAMTVAIEHQNPAMAKMLIEYGYKMNKRYQWKETPLSQAINLHSEECAMTLVHEGCNLKKKKGHSYFYMAVDEKLIRLVKFMAAVNPQFLQEQWVLNSEWPVSIYHRPDLIEWLSKESQQVRKLRQLCRAKVFTYLGKYAPYKMAKLKLPDGLKEYMAYDSHVKEDFFAQHPLNVTGECPIDCPAICTRKYCPPIEVSSSESESEEVDDDEIISHPVHDHIDKHEHDIKARCCEYCH